MKPPTRSPIHKIEAYTSGQESGAARNTDPFQAGALYAMVSLLLAYAAAFETDSSTHSNSPKRTGAGAPERSRSGVEIRRTEGRFRSFCAGIWLRAQPPECKPGRDSDGG